MVAKQAHFCDCYRNMGNYLCGVETVVFCERSFALHRQQLENNKQNIDVASLEKFLRTPVSSKLSLHAAERGQ